MTRLMPSHTARRRELVSTGANMSASSSRPAICIIARSELSRIWSTTSSTVMRPSRRRSASTTGAESRSRSWNRCATSSAGISTRTDGISLSITSRDLALRRGGYQRAEPQHTLEDTPCDRPP